MNSPRAASRLLALLLALSGAAGAVLAAAPARAQEAHAPADEPAASAPAASAAFRLELGGHRRQVEVRRLPDGRHVFVVGSDEGQGRTLSPEEFAEWTLAPPSQGRLLERLLNISSVAGFAWVALGLLGQVLFTGRMLVQWLASEREKRSIIPTAFWWMSLGGSIMLVAYFLWRRDVVGVIGQSTGCFIYVRNLRLIYRKSP